MLNNSGSEFAQKFEQWLDSNILFGQELKDEFSVKVSLLERMVELARFYRENYENRFSLAELRGLNLDFTVNGKIRAEKRENLELFRLLKDPLKPVQLEIPLLVFLMINYRKKQEVFSLIESFIKEIRPNLSPLDFEKTRTGVTRCFTNTRFAAVVLRDYGLLRFGYKEAFKKWQLSFLGIVVASQLYEPDWRAAKKWDIDYFHNVPKRLCIELDQVVDLLRNPDIFEKTLRVLCSRSKVEFKAFDKTLTEIHSLVIRYSRVLIEEKLDIRGKSKKLLNILNQLEGISSIEKFLEDFSLVYDMKDFNMRMSVFLRQE